MTLAEREELDANPLWSDEGQMLWLLDQQRDGSELLTAAESAERLKVQQPTASHTLRRLQREGKVRECTVDRRELWGTSDQVARWLGRRRREEQRVAEVQAAARAQIVEGNQALAETAHRLRAGSFC